MKDWIRRQLIERQYPVGQSPVMFQQWLCLLFIHWPFPPGVVQATLPRGLEVDTLDDRAWIGIVPFFMRGVRPAGLPSVPGISSFLELNLRTYVRDLSGRPGIWFYSLDANQPLAVCMARAGFALPYRFSHMAAKVSDGQIEYSSRPSRSGRTFQYCYRPLEKIGEAPFGSLEFFLIERYRLFATRKNRLLTACVNHAPYQLQKVSITRADAELFAEDGFVAPVEPPAHATYSQRVDVSIFPITNTSMLK
jgi:uncharacterized protein